MAQRVVPFLHTPLEAPEFLDLWRSTLRNGVVRASEATTGGSGWKVTVKAGEVIIDGSWIYDDLDKIDGLDLGHVAGSDRHYVVYQTYAYAGSDPPATSVFAVTAGVAPPTQPTIPAGAVKLCDIFVPASALSIGSVPGGNQQDPVQVSSTGVRFVQAPRLWPREDTAELMDKLVVAGTNTMTFTQGAITYDDATGNLVFSQPVIVQSLCTTYRQAFNNAPSIVRASLASGTYVAPGTPGSRDVVIYMLLDRSSPTTALTGTLKFLNRVAPAATELNELLSHANRTQIVVLGVISGARLFMPGVQGQLPTPVADERRYMQDRASGVHQWELVKDTEIVGGARAVADVAARDAIAADLRKEGMIVYCQDVDRHFVLEGGVANGDWKEHGDDNRLVGGLQTVADIPARDAIPAAKRKEGMVVYSQADDRHFVLEGGLTNSDWRELGDDGRLIGGMRVVADLTTIPLAKQKVDMLVMLSTTNTVYRLNATSAPPIPAANWIKLFTANGGTDAIAALSVDEMYFAGVGMRQIEASHVRNIKGRESVANQGSSRVSWGLELLPTTVSLLPDFAPAAVLKPGRGVSANGAQVNPSSDITADLTDAANYLPSSSPPVSYPANIYAFVDYDQQLRFSTTAPDQFGRPATAEAGYAVGDYVYVGMMRPKTDVGADHEAVWGNFVVAHDGFGHRKIGFDVEDSTLEGATANPVNLTTSQTIAIGPTTAPSSLFPTAKTLMAMHHTVLLGPVSGNVILTCQVDCARIRIRNQLNGMMNGVDSNVLVEIPNRTTRPNVRATPSFSGGPTSLDFTHSLRYVGITENVNNPVPLRQSVNVF